MEEPRSRREFTEMVARPDDEVDLAAAALLVACEEYGELDVPEYLRRLDGMAGEVKARVADPGPFGAVAALNAVLFGTHGFKGNVDEYYDPRNSFLNEVLDRRVGIPLSLSTVYIEVGRRAGLDVDGVGLPGHFIVRVCGTDPDQGSLLVDPFHEGAVLSREDCQERLDRIYEGKVKLDATMLARCGGKAILARMLRNLKGIYTRTEDTARALRVVELLLRVLPASMEDLRDRGLLHGALGCYGWAIRDLEEYLARVPGATDADEIRGQLVELRRLGARIN